SDPAHNFAIWLSAGSGGAIYAASVNRIQRIAPDGTVEEWDTVFDGIYGLTVRQVDGEDNIYVAQGSDDWRRIRVFSADGTQLSSSDTIYTDPEDPNSWIEPGAMAFNSQGLLVVIDERSDRVYVLNSEW